MPAYPTGETLLHLDSIWKLPDDIDRVGKETERAHPLTDDEGLMPGLDSCFGCHQAREPHADDDEIVMHKLNELPSH